MAETNFFMRTGNLIFAGILRSPLHGMISKNFMLVSVTGRKSGKIYTTPVNYHRQDEALRVVSQSERTWWRNLRGEGARVMLRLQGKDVVAWGRVLETEPDITEALGAYLSREPQNARYLGIKLGPNGQPEPEDIRQAAEGKVIVEFQPQPPAS
jgi:deazaflavin-dependent oxidoreductase (nitroreductase family)